MNSNPMRGMSTCILTGLFVTRSYVSCISWVPRKRTATKGWGPVQMVQSKFKKQVLIHVQATLKYTIWWIPSLRTMQMITFVFWYRLKPAWDLFQFVFVEHSQWKCEDQPRPPTTPRLRHPPAHLHHLRPHPSQLQNTRKYKDRGNTRLFLVHWSVMSLVHD